MTHALRYWYLQIGPGIQITVISYWETTPHSTEKCMCSIHQMLVLENSILTAQTILSPDKASGIKQEKQFSTGKKNGTVLWGQTVRMLTFEVLVGGIAHLAATGPARPKCNISLNPAKALTVESALKTPQCFPRWHLNYDTNLFSPGS